MGAQGFWQLGRAVLNDPSLVFEDVLKVDIGNTTNFLEAANRAAKELFQRAIDSGENFARALSYQSYTYVQDWQNDWGSNPSGALDIAHNLALEAVSLSPSDYDNQWGLAIALVNMGPDHFDDGMSKYAEALSMAPDDPDLLAEMGEALIDGGRAGDAIDNVIRAFDKNPLRPYWYYWTLGRAYYSRERYEDAIGAISQIDVIPPDARLVTAASYAQLKKPEKAKEEMALFQAGSPSWTLEKSKRYFYAKTSDHNHWLEGLEAAGLPKGT